MITRNIFIVGAALTLCLAGCDESTPPGEDAALDAEVADQQVPDQPATDQPLPDKLVPDKLAPDMLAPDMLAPDMLAPDAPLPTCTDKLKNGSETGVDCGGPSCPKCGKGGGCASGTDCVSGVCDSGKCLEPTCTDGVKNSAETDVDCGGGTCVACAAGKKCSATTDCASGVCDGGLCKAASCTDKVKNGSETDVDCGGGFCPKCANKSACSSAADCLSGVCTAGVCAAPACTDTIKNGDESDVDCGGSSCAGCAAGKACAKAGDCVSGVCAGGVCQAASCTDKIKNGAETDVDCGGGTCAGCAVGKACTAGKDCASGTCTAGKCVNPTYTSCKGATSGKSGLYWLDPDGAGGVPAFQVWCLMTTAGGGWILVTNRKKGTVTKHTSKPLTPKDSALAVTNARWAALRAISTETIAVFGKTVYKAKLSVLASANCNPLAKDLTVNQLAHHENSGCTETGVDYSCWFGAESHGVGGTTYFSDCSSKRFWTTGGCVGAEPAEASMYVR